MTIRLLSLLLLFVMLGAARQPGKPVHPGERSEWSMDDGRKLYRLGNMTALLIAAEIRKDFTIWPSKCKLARNPENDTCPDRQLIEYPDYATALRAYLAELGYTPRA